MKHDSINSEFGAISVDVFNGEGDDHSAMWVTMHADNLDISQKTETYTREDGTEFKVKEVTAYDENRNEVKLRIFFDS